MPVTRTEVTVTTSPTLLFTAPAYGGPVKVEVHSGYAGVTGHGAALYVGGSGVTTATGQRVYSVEEFNLQGGGTIYGVLSAGSGTVVVEAKPA